MSSINLAVASRWLQERFPQLYAALGRNPAATRLVDLYKERRQWQTVNAALAGGETRAAFASGGRLPDGYGPGLTERVVEYPWALTRLTGDTVLDAGSTFNHAPLVGRFSDRELTIATLMPEAKNFLERRISYVYADLRALPFDDGVFDQVLSVSVLEHVGMDNRGYGADGHAAGDPGAQARAALAELGRVVVPGGRILVTVPYGQRMDMEWSRQFDHDDLNELLEAVGAASVAVTLYHREEMGWQLANREQADGAVYRDGAYAVACVDVRL
jgi:SAM-dependent methyltransferase